MQSLRSLRSRRSNSSKSKPAPRDARAKSRVDDKIKKRMSRYAEISSPTELSPPPLPAIHQAFALPLRGPSPRISLEESRNRSEKEDKKLLDAEDFDPDAFLKLKLANSTEAELKSLQSSLHAAKEDTAADLQRSVFKNYAEFVLISKEISTLENELLEIKVLLSDYKSMPSLLHIPDPTTLTSSTLSTYKRSSIADLRVMYYNQMQALHSSIEGASKFAPITPGRHVVSEMEGIFSLNAATYRTIGKVKFVILDDAVLVARQRRRHAGNDGSRGATSSEGKLVAERCWPLNDLLVLDTKDSPSMTNVLKIKHGKETHVYRTETYTDKKALLVQLRQVAEELVAKKRKEREGEHERRKTLFQAGGGDRNTIPPMPEWLADLARRGGDIPGAGAEAKEKAERDARWTNDWADQLTVAIALREWTKAVELVEKAQERQAMTPPLENKLSVLKSQLITALLDAVSKPTIRKSSVIVLVSLLRRLRAGSAARNTLLRMRSKLIRSHIRNIRFEGNISTYIGDLATVCFTGIKHTADWFLASFKENEVASSFIDWAKKEIEEFAEIFRKQVFTPDVDPKIVHEAVKIAHAQSKKLLQEYGIDFAFLLNELLVEKPKEPFRLSSTFSFNTHSRLSKHPSQLTSPSITPKQSTSTNGVQTPIQNITSPSSVMPQVPALPSYLKQSKSLSKSEPDRAPTPPSFKSSDRIPTPVKSSDRALAPSSFKSPDRVPTPLSFKLPDRVPTPQSVHFSERAPTPKASEVDQAHDLPFTFPLTSPTSPGLHPYSVMYETTPTSATPFTTFGSMLSPSTAANGRAVFSIPSRSGVRTPMSSKEPSKSMGPPTSASTSASTTVPTYVSPLSSPVPPSSASMPRTPLRKTSTTSLNSVASGVPGLSARTPPPRPLRAPGPPTPARSTNRPTGHRPPPLAVPPHDGMF
ncbi:hypothetical protein APHAL10511_002973 [Amanita phalloides]|nr:hypothetical protein APHAL10511_002973 [Amanita phalloides]